MGVLKQLFLEKMDLENYVESLEEQIKFAKDEGLDTKDLSLKLGGAISKLDAFIDKFPQI